MRYQIFRLQQEALLELGLNVEEALLLDWLLNWKDGSNMERIVIGDDLAYWVNYSKVIEELPILFKTPKSDSVEDIEKCKKANATKVARMLKGNLSKVLTRHERKAQGKTKIYISINRDKLDMLLNNKKAPVSPQTEANKELETFKNSNKNSIPQNNNSNNNYGKKLKTRYHNINQTFKKYSDDELEKLLQESQKDKFEFVPSYGKTNHEN